MSKFAILGTMAAFFITSPAYAVPMTCKVALSSPEGGRLDVTRIDATPATPRFPFIIPGAWGATWHPPASRNSVELSIDYEIDNPKSLGRPLDAYVEFMPSEGASTEQYTAMLSMDGMKDIRLKGVGVDILTHQYSLRLQGDGDETMAIGRAIAQGKPVRISLFKAEKDVDSEDFDGTLMKLVVLREAKEVASETFDISKTVGRDHLFAKAQRLIETSDPSVCKPSN